MSDHEFVRLSLQEVGPRDERIMQVVQTGKETWAVRFEEIDVEIELEPDSRRLMFSTEIGLVPADRRREVCELLLNYSLLWRETGGLRMAMEPEGCAILLVDLHCSQLTVDLLATLLRNLEERALLWRELFTGAQGEESVTPQPPAPEFPMIQI